MTKNPSAKGFGFERKVAKQLSLWWSDGNNKDVFWRVSGSGGRATRSTTILGGVSYGDIGLLDPSGEALLRICTFELKKGYTKDLDMMSLIDAKSDNLFWKFWMKVSNDAAKAALAGWGKEPILITNRNHKMPLATIRYSFYLKLFDYIGKFNEDWPMIAIRKGEEVTRTMTSDHFLEWLHPKIIQTLWNRENKNANRN